MKALTSGTTTLHGTAAAPGELLRAPASGVPCAHWRLRIVEQVAPRLEFVHEVVSPEPLEILWQPDPSCAPTRVRVAAEHAQLQAAPAVFRPGSPGALAVAEQFGLRGAVLVEEVVIKHGEALEAEGMLTDPATALSRGPFRSVDLPPELLEPVIRLGSALSLRPVILPWALGTAAALLGSVGVGAAVAHWWKGPLVHPGSLPIPAEIGARPIPHRHWP